MLAEIGFEFLNLSARSLDLFLEHLTCTLPRLFLKGEECLQFLLVLLHLGLHLHLLLLHIATFSLKDSKVLCLCAKRTLLLAQQLVVEVALIMQLLPELRMKPHFLLILLDSLLDGITPCLLPTDLVTKPYHVTHLGQVLRCVALVATRNRTRWINDVALHGHDPHLLAVGRVVCNELGYLHRGCDELFNVYIMYYKVPEDVPHRSRYFFIECDEVDGWLG